MPLDLLFRDRIVSFASTARGESAELDFKDEVRLSGQGSAHGWNEVVRDIVAMANTDGGIIVFGCTSSGRPTGADLNDVLAVDQSTIVEKVFSATGENFGEIRIDSVTKAGIPRPAWVIGKSSRLLVFSRDASAERIDGRTRRLPFRRGVVGVRHGSKSDIASAADLDRMIDGRVTERLGEYLGRSNFAAVAPQGVTVASPAGAPGAPINVAATYSASSTGSRTPPRARRKRAARV